MSHQTTELPDFLRTLSPATQIMIQRRLEIGDLEGTNFLMKSESAEVRRKYELWKMREGLLKTKLPTEWRSGPSRLGMNELQVEMFERHKNIAKMLKEVSRKQRGNMEAVSPKKFYISTLYINVPLTFVIPEEEEQNQVYTTTAVLGLRSDYC